MFNIEKRILKSELKYKGVVVLTYEIEYPQIFSGPYDTSKFNMFNRRKALFLEATARETLFNQAKELYDYNVSNGYPVMVFEVVSKYRITYNEPPILSLYQDEYIFTGGAHGDTTRTSQNWDFAYNKQFSLDDVYYNNPDYILCILKQINEQIKSAETGTYFDDYCQLVLETFNPNQFYLTNQGVTIYFQHYDIAPYSSGIPEFNVNC